MALTASGVGTCGADDNQAQAGHLIPQAWPIAVRGRDGGSQAEVGEEGLANTLRAGDGSSSRQALIAHTLTAEGADASEDGTGRGTPLVPVLGVGLHGEVSGGTDDLAQSVTTSNGQPGGVINGLAVRRLTPRECERLQGLPDDWTAGHPDSARYRFCGNGGAVPVMEWILARLIEADEVDA